MNILMKSHKQTEWKETTLENFTQSVNITKEIIMEMGIKNRNIEEYDEEFALRLLQSGEIIDTPVILFKLGEGENTNKCPICGRIYMGEGALSRRDNEIYICSQCGMNEAMEDIKEYPKQKNKDTDIVKIFDLQTKEYSAHNTIEGLFEMLCMGYCECGEGYDRLDKKDGKMKCLNCWRLNNFDKISKKEMIQEIEENEYRIDGIIEH